MTAAVAPAPAGEEGRPTRALPLAQLIQMSVYWFGLSAIFPGLDIALQARMPEIVGEDLAGRAIALVGVLGAIVAVVVQPTVGSISDYTVSRWGRRKPYILVGSVLDVVFLVAIATSQAYLALLVFIVLLQFSSNLAQGPFQGYLPDLVPAPQVGLASALVGLMTLLGSVTGVAIASVGVATGQFALPIIALGVVELLTAIVLVATVQEGRAPRDRQGRPWRAVAAEAWSMDVLRERSFMWLVLSRFFFLAGVGMLLRVGLFFMDRSLGLTDVQAGTWVFLTTIAVAAGTLFATIPSARVSDRVGRKLPIYAASVVGALGMLIVAAAAAPEIAVAGAVLVGLATGTFVAVDWALMTDIIPKASAGRYMGISNVAGAMSGVVGGAAGLTLMDLIDGAVKGPTGPRAALLIAVGFLLLAALLLRPVDPTRR